MTNFPNDNQKSRMVCISCLLMLTVSLWNFCQADNVTNGQSPTGRVTRVEDINDFKDDAPAAESNNQQFRKFVTSLRFWDKGKNTTGNKPAAAKTIEPVKPVVQSSGGKTSKTPPAALLGTSTTPSVTDTAQTNTAPTPPPLPFLASQKTIQQPQVSVAETVTPSELPGTPRTAPVSSTYSFDSREWVDSYSVQNAVPYHAEHPALQRAEEPISNTVNSAANQKTSDDWNGDTVALAHPAPQVPLPTDMPVRRPMVSVSAKVATNSPLADNIGTTPDLLTDIDLTPSYKKQLPYCEVCGVVVVQSNFPLKEMSAILTEIEQLQNDLHKYMGVPAPKEKIELCLFKSEESYISFLKQNFPNAPLDRRALFVKSEKKPATLMVQKSKDFEIDLRHEMTHAIIHASIDNVPIWLDEGLAKYFEVPSADRAMNNPYMKNIRWAVKFGMVPSLNRLAKLETTDDMASKEYQDSWAWTHFLIHRSAQTHQLLAAYMQMLGRLPESAASGKTVQIPPISLYLKDIVANPREDFREHFGAND